MKIMVVDRPDEEFNFRQVGRELPILLQPLLSCPTPNPAVIVQHFRFLVAEANQLRVEVAVEEVAGGLPRAISSKSLVPFLQQEISHLGQVGEEEKGTNL